MKLFEKFFPLIFLIWGTGLAQANSLAPLKEGITRNWIGPEYWTNPLMNWRLSNGRIENTHGGWVNEVHSLTHQLKEGDGNFSMQVRLGSSEDQTTSASQVAFVGFKFGAVGHRNDYRSNILHDLEGAFAEELAREPPLRAGFTTDGRLLIGSEFSEPLLNENHMKDVLLGLEVVHEAKVAKARLTVSVANKEIGALESSLERESLSGNIALACHGLNPPRRKRRDATNLNHPKFWFSGLGGKRGQNQLPAGADIRADSLVPIHPAQKHPETDGLFRAYGRWGRQNGRTANPFRFEMEHHGRKRHRSPVPHGTVSGG